MTVKIKWFHLKPCKNNIDKINFFLTGKRVGEKKSDF